MTFWHETVVGEPAKVVNYKVGPPFQCQKPKRLSISPLMISTAKSRLIDWQLPIATARVFSPAVKKRLRHHESQAATQDSADQSNALPSLPNIDVLVQRDGNALPFAPTAVSSNLVERAVVSEDLLPILRELFLADQASVSEDLLPTTLRELFLTDRATVSEDLLPILSGRFRTVAHEGPRDVKIAATVTQQIRMAVLSVSCSATPVRFAQLPVQPTLDIRFGTPINQGPDLSAQIFKLLRIRDHNCERLEHANCHTGTLTEQLRPLRVWSVQLGFSHQVWPLSGIQIDRVLVRELDFGFTLVAIYGTEFGRKASTSNETPQPSPRQPRSLQDPSRPHSTRKRPRVLTNNFLALLLPALRPSLNLEANRHLDLPGQLRRYQVEGIHHLVSNIAFLLADEMGTGKTVMAIVAMKILIQRGSIMSVLVVCPKSILDVWQTHLAKWAPDLKVTVAYGSPGTRELLWMEFSHVYLTTYDILMKDVGSHVAKHRRNQFDLIVVDEAHHLRNPSTQRARSARRLSSNYKWALTGTPVQNSVSEMLALFRFLKQDLFPYWMIDERTASPAGVQAAISSHFLRRRKVDVMSELPPKIYSDEWFELDVHQRKQYAALLKDFHNSNPQVKKFQIFPLIQKLKQICNFSKEHATSPKSDALCEHVAEIVSSGHKVIVFSNFVTEGVTKLQPLLSEFGLAAISGDTSYPERKRLVRQFQEDASLQVFLATTKTAGEGLTLTAASYVIHFDHWWNPAVQWQAEDRAHRHGQKESVNIYNYWTKDTIEERIRDGLERKGLLHQQYVESMSDSDFEKALSSEDLCEMLGIDISRLVS